MKRPIFRVTVATALYKQLKLVPILTMFPTQHKRAAPLEDKLKVVIHHYLWDIPSDVYNHNLIFGTASHKDVMNLQKGWKSVVTYRNFRDYLRALPNSRAIHLAIVTEVRRVLRELNIIPFSKELRSLEDLRTVFHAPHTFKDRGISYSFCAAKKQTFFGRGGLLAIIPSLEIPLFIRSTPKYKQGGSSLLSFIKMFHKAYKSLLDSSVIVADSEFGTESFMNYVTYSMNSSTSITGYGTSHAIYSLIPNHNRCRCTIERVIGRLETTYSLEHPPCLGTSNVALHLQLCTLSDLVLAYFNIILNNLTSPHSLESLGGKIF